MIRGADISSDHYLLKTAARLRLKKFNNTTNTRTRYNVNALKTKEVGRVFHFSLSNRFQPLQDQLENDDTNIETEWQHIKEMLRDTCEEVLGRRNAHHKEWISVDTMEKLDVRKEKKAALNTSRTRAAKAKAQEDYTTKDKEVNKSISKDKWDHIDNLVKLAEEAAGQGNLREMYMVTMKLSNKFRQTDKPVKDKNRNSHNRGTTKEMGRTL